MALFNGTVRQEGSRSNTHLVKSGHMAPATDWKLDPKFASAEMSGVFNEGVLVNYKYGGPGNEEVVIPKGRLVGVGAPMKDFETGLYKTTVTLPGLATGGNTVGVAPYNFTKDMLQLDRFGGNHPTIITMDYITLPYMPNIAPSAKTGVAGVLEEETDISVTNKMPWGALIGPAQEGDFVKATVSGRFTKWVAGTDADHLRVGQILEMDLNQEPWGWIQWVLFDPSARKEDDAVINRSGASNLPSDAGFPYDPAYRDGLTINESYQTQFVSNPTGIPGLHDGSGNYYGFGKNDTLYTRTLGDVPADVEADEVITYQLTDNAGNPIKNLQEGVVIKIDNVAVDAARLVINYAAGTVKVKMVLLDAEKTVTAEFKAISYGTPSYLDFKGVVGSASILLKM